MIGNLRGESYSQDMLHRVRRFGGCRYRGSRIWEVFVERISSFSTFGCEISLAIRLSLTDATEYRGSSSESNNI